MEEKDRVASTEADDVQRHATGAADAVVSPGWVVWEYIEHLAVEDGALRTACVAVVSFAESRHYELDRSEREIHVPAGRSASEPLSRPYASIDRPC
jgi:hypothetical protein